MLKSRKKSHSLELGYPMDMSKTSRIGFQSFLAGFTQGGLFRWADYPGSPTVLCEETTDFAESQFAGILAPYVPSTSASAQQEVTLGADPSLSDEVKIVTDLRIKPNIIAAKKAVEAALREAGFTSSMELSPMDNAKIRERVYQMGLDSRHAQPLKGKSPSGIVAGQKSDHVTKSHGR